MENDEKALKYALNILNKKDYTEFEMARKLKLKKFNDDIIEKVLQYLRENSLINDDRFTESFVYFKLQNGYGKKRIRYDLHKKGINDECIDKYLKDVDEMQFAGAVFEAKSDYLKDNKNGRAKMFALLLRRGFDYETINALFNKNKEV